MFGILSGGKKQKGGLFVTARLNARLQPLDRGEIFEDPLDEALRADGLGEVTGGGTQLDESGEIEFCDIEIEINAAEVQAVERVVSNLEKLGAPNASKLIVSDGGQELPFGKSEGLAVYLNGTDLDDDVYQTCDVNHVIAELDRLLAEAGRYRSYWEGPGETALYLYGENAMEMRNRIAPFIEAYPLCRNARIEQIA